MDKNQALDLIFKCLKNEIRRKVFVGLYVGKTSDLVEREEYHKSNGYQFFYQLAESNDAETISWIENALIKELRNDIATLPFLDNKNDGSAGDTNCKQLYVAFRANKNIKYDDLFDDVFPISEEFPLKISNKK